ncbi:MAG: UbiA family prenyltransferase [Crocinitomicaceae bacterium]|nr:UbiA family prenyltransferase [Crocinitomicaceae bacterium]
MLRKIIEALVYSNLWISGGALSMTWLFYILVEVELNFKVLAFIFFSTWLTYTFQRYMKFYYGEKWLGPRMKWMERHHTIVKVILYISLLGTILFSIYLSLISILLLAFLGAISFLYAYKFKLTSKRMNLRDVPGIKIFLIGLVWALSCAIIPAIEENMFNAQVVMISWGYLFFIIGITIPFDIRDIDYDEVHKKTIPQVLGTQNAKIVASILVIISYVLINFPEYNRWPLGVGLTLAVYLVLMSNKKRDELFYSFLMDGLLIMIPVIYFVLSRPYFIAN